MSEMVERAIAAGVATGLDFADWSFEPQEELVRAIINSMLEPSREMEETLRRYLANSGQSQGARSREGRKANDFIIIYQAMIEAGLK